MSEISTLWKAGKHTAAPVVGALVLPTMAAQLPSLGLLAAAGITSFGIGVLFGLPLFALNIWKKDFAENHPLLLGLIIITLEVAAIAAASALLHQAFLPLLATIVVGNLIINAGLLALNLLLKGILHCLEMPEPQNIQHTYSR
jgi:hypothetical protein